jgi:hypothetical protein
MKETDNRIKSATETMPDPHVLFFCPNKNFRKENLKNGAK